MKWMDLKSELSNRELDIEESKLILEESKFYYDIDYDSKRDILDKIIKEEIENWLFIEYRNAPEEKDRYLREEDIIKATKDITLKIITERLTDHAIATISLYYRINSNEEEPAIEEKSSAFKNIFEIVKSKFSKKEEIDYEKELFKSAKKNKDNDVDDYIIHLIGLEVGKAMGGYALTINNEILSKMQRMAKEKEIV